MTTIRTYRPKTKRPLAWEARLLNEMREMMTDRARIARNHPGLLPFRNKEQRRSYFSPTHHVVVELIVRDSENGE